MEVYKLLKINRLIKNHRIKFFGLWLFHQLDKRYLSVNFDPVLACNLKCKMCYFTDEDFVRTKAKGIFPAEDLEKMGKSIFSRALKLQIGCGAEPTLYKNLNQIVKIGKEYKVPYISITTNANLLSREQIFDLAKMGLNEFTVSLHGVHKDEYEFFMGKASYEKFLESLKNITEAKKIYPNLKLRINYTFNKDNFASLKDFFKIFGNFGIDVLQIRPIKKIGETEYHDFDITSLRKIYMETISDLRKECEKRETLLLASQNFDGILNENNESSLIYKYTYCYISPRFFWREGFDWKTENFNEFSKRTLWSKEIFSNIFKGKKQLETSNEVLNYDII